jgi:glutamate 5-kinase
VEIARGLVNYSAEEARIIGQSSNRIQELFGASMVGAIHRDNLVLMT